ncbi:uncharacterized protein LOC134251958 isoform X1 [Saccostrea cucullata]|uniref:uncharacterized protein LOC134251958 isoform X1 n=1 Tax=Saccostrea cuccullata TaxID=36930 RepID=UPI002ED393A1
MLPKKRMKLRSQPAQAPLVESALGNAVDASSSATQASCTNNPPIDYDQLAAAILRQQQALTPSSASSNNIVSQATPSTSQAVPSASSTSSSDPSSLNLVNTLQQLFSGSGSQEICPLVGPQANSSTRTFDLHLSQPSRQLLQASLSLSSKQLYLRSWNLLKKFCDTHSIPFSLPFAEGIICNFIGELFTEGLSPSTITSHVSAISFVHKIFDFHDPTHSFIVRKVIKGAQNLARTVDTRLPITKPILIKLLSALDHTVQEADSRTLLSAIFLLAFHAFMRLGELVPRNKTFNSKVIQRQDIMFNDDNSVQITLRYSKTMNDRQPIIITLTANNLKCQFCPVHALKAYIAEHKHTSGPLFTFKSGEPVPHNFVTSHLKHAINFIGLNSSLYLGHSFRIGAATEAAKNGLSENVIQQLGRWHSNASRRYIRINAFKF